jgi:hypothetical protein
MTGLSVVAAVLIAIVQLADVLVESLGLGGPLPWLAAVGVDDLGFVLTGLLLVTWAALLIVTRNHTAIARVRPNALRIPSGTTCPGSRRARACSPSRGECCSGGGWVGW